MPEELLGQIFEHFVSSVPNPDKGQFPAPPEVWVDYRTLQALSLTCRAFRSQAQHKLFRHCKVSPFIHNVPGKAWRRLERLAIPLFGGLGSNSAMFRNVVTSLQVCWSANHQHNGLVLELLASCRNISYLALDFEHRGDGVQRLPVERAIELLEKMEKLQSLNLRFTEVDVHLEYLYVPDCLSFQLPHLRSLRMKGVPTAYLHKAVAHPIPHLKFLHLEYFDLSPDELPRYVSQITEGAELEELSLVDLEDSCDVLQRLPQRLHRSVKRLTLDLDSTSLDLRPLAFFSGLTYLNLGYSPFSPKGMPYFPPALDHLAFYPSTIQQLETLASLLASIRFLPSLRTIQLWGIDDSLWSNEDATYSEWMHARTVVHACVKVAKLRRIEVKPSDWQMQFEQRCLYWSTWVSFVYVPSIKSVSDELSVSGFAILTGRPLERSSSTARSCLQCARPISEVQHLGGDVKHRLSVGTNWPTTEVQQKYWALQLCLEALQCLSRLRRTQSLTLVTDL